jgi:aspartate/methionine/tyrosine aminotransferase
VWPNLTAQPAILGAEVVRVPLRAGADGAWRLDLDALRDAVTPRTRMLLVNAPNNPTGWALSSDEQRALLDHCRRTGTWIVADEVYERLWYGAGGPGAAAPSFLDHAAPDDRLIVVHSFSKSYLMTGWRLGWLVLPEGCAATAGTLLEYNSSCAPVFVQRGALAALALGDGFVGELVGRCRAGRDRLLAGLQLMPGVDAASPDAGLYLFFRVRGQNDSVAFAKRLVHEVGLGLAPGAAFGPEAEGWLRWCFATADPSRLDAGLDRLLTALRL